MAPTTAPNANDSSSCSSESQLTMSQPQHIELQPRCKSAQLPRPDRSILKKRSSITRAGTKAAAADVAAAASKPVGKAKKSVSFGSGFGQAGDETAELGADVQADIHEIERWQDMSEDERACVWFSRDEFAEIKRSYRDIIARMRNKELLRDTDEVSTRGLECRSGAGSQRRRDTQVNSMMAVLGEQARQRNMRLHEVETLAVLYRQYSYHAQQAATNMGRRDEFAVADYIQNLPKDLQVGMSETLLIRISLPSAPSSGRRNLGFGGSPLFAARNGRIKMVSSRGGAARSSAATGRRRAAAA